MADDRTEDSLGSPDFGGSVDSDRPKRAGPTIDLQAHEVASEVSSPKVTDEPSDATSLPSSPRRSGATSSILMAAASGACAAALVMGAVWFSGWPSETHSSSAAPQTNTAALDALTSRVADVETRSAALTSAPASTSTRDASAQRIDALEKSVASLHDELSSLSAQSDKLAIDLRSLPHDTAPAADLTAINARIAQIEHSDRTQSAQIAQANAKPADDAALRRVLVASMLDSSVRHGDSYTDALNAAKAVADNPDALKPLDVFASSGVPSAAAMSRDLLNLVSRLAPATAELSPAETGFVDRLQAGASRLVRIERTNASGNDRNAIVARITAAALRNDPEAARRELNALAPADRAAAQSWIDQADARDAALAVSRQFTADAMAVLAKPVQ